MTIFDLTHEGLGQRMPDALVAAMDRVELALTQACTALAAVGDRRGATPSAVARRSGESLADTRRFLARLATDGAAVQVGEGRSARYRVVQP